MVLALVCFLKFVFFYGSSRGPGDNRAMFSVRDLVAHLSPTSNANRSVGDHSNDNNRGARPRKEVGKWISLSFSERFWETRELKASLTRRVKCRQRTINRDKKTREYQDQDSTLFNTDNHHAYLLVQVFKYL